MRKHIKRMLVSMTIIANIISVLAVNAATNESFFSYYIQFGENAIITGYNATGGNDVVIPNTLEGYPVVDIDRNAFRNHSSITSIKISDSVYNIGDWAFGNCTGLSSIIFGNKVVSIGEGAFAGCENLNSITILYGVARIYDFTFLNCFNLSEITIPDTVTRIGMNAFSNCAKLTSVTIPEKVTQIGSYAFSACRSLNEIAFNSLNPPNLGEDIFENCDKLTTINVPFGSKAAYQAIGQLSEYNIVESVNTAVISVTNITGITATAVAGDSLNFNGKIVPTDATYKTIVWSVQDAGTTGASFSGNIFNTTSEGTTTIRATVTNGIAAGVDYTQDFIITVKSFVPVTDIAMFTPVITAELFNPLWGNVEPSNATNNFVQWSILDAGTTGSTIQSMEEEFVALYLIAQSPGIVKIRATIENGRAIGIDYTQDFTIIIVDSLINNDIFFDIVESDDNNLIEIHNLTNNAILCKVLYLSDDVDNLFKWQMPSAIIRAGQTINIKANDNNTFNVLKRMQTNFYFNVGETVSLTDAKGNIISWVEVN